MCSLSVMASAKGVKTILLLIRPAMQSCLPASKPSTEAIPSLLANILSAIVWVPLMLAPGYLAAKSVEAAKHANQLTLYIGGGISIVIGVWLLYMFTRQRKAPQQRTRRRARAQADDQAAD